MENESYVKIITEWDIVAARQLGRNVAKELGFGTVDQARITTAISELARNIYLYAGKGEMQIERINKFGKKGLKVIALDNGPGIDDIRRVMEDGFSTSGGLGAGLPGVKRLMDDFDITSSVGKGTTIQVVKWLR
ncbi:anti-sigma regulatory factor [Metabacillus fastidiosus]|uniref:Anti-sigma regulatory factor n=1 Tax=Metabacillus fastidiosus TaxID=1458 RepID=A0ABU6NUK8_9BACI|nr:anti-sigma regulatory factor [Metabacillus fastidiosus]MED4400585.1 anti-sigma regulatory factor [Metabacillus fastidiosus]MED4455810.1 anti-sigma regulatory factor [Metabacillus fastidiosus]MED4464520.1 anti-sigma regulatory factor [Metabacillus fastidiosus]MED4534357.1 anti-sigma regulatory factor [Metabacillus fastidiosus]